MKKHRSTFASGAKLLLVFVVGLVGLWTITHSGNFLSEAEPPSGLTCRIERGDLTVTIEEQGILESEENFEIKSKKKY